MDDDPARIESEEESEVEAHKKSGKDLLDEGASDDTPDDDFELHQKAGST